MRGWSENGFPALYEGSLDGKGGRLAIVLMLGEGQQEGDGDSTGDMKEDKTDLNLASSFLYRSTVATRPPAAPAIRLSHFRPDTRPLRFSQTAGGRLYIHCINRRFTLERGSASSERRRPRNLDHQMACGVVACQPMRFFPD